MRWKLSAFADEAGADVDQQIRSLQQAGLNYIDPRSVGTYNIVDLPVEVAQEVQAKLLAAGISVSMYGSPIGKIDVTDDLKTDLDRLDRLAKLSEVFKCHAVRMFSFYNKQDLPRASWRDQSLERLGKLIHHAQKLGLVLYHENERHIWGDTLDQVTTLIPLRGDHFKLIFDFDNYNQSGDDVWQNWLALRDVTDAIHLKDSDENNQHTPVGQGNGQVEKILIDALSRGWQGPLTLEPHLSHSGAVAATGPSGQANQSYKNMSPPECFDIAATVAKALCVKIKAPIV